MLNLEGIFEKIKAEIARLEAENKLLKKFLSTVDFSELKTDYEECLQANEELKKLVIKDSFANPIAKASVSIQYKKNGFTLDLFKYEPYTHTHNTMKTHQEIKKEAIDYIVNNLLI